MTSSDSHAHESAKRTPRESSVGGALSAVVTYLRMAVYFLTALLGLSLLIVGTNAIMAELQGSWHWQIHLQSTVSFMGVFIGALLVVLVPLFALLLAGRCWQYVSRP